ncbi:hypothetical protein QM012_006362 [Aureobasidium pullulans]|uniref:Phenylalanine ammonia-lyase n=1 Tax=Aureobasidium pullulans TaxID=5580 RepID=A0ABR0TNN9_AURPU
MNHTQLVQQEWELLDAIVQGEPSNSIVLTGHDLTIPQVVAIARHHARTNLGSDAIEKMQDSLNMLEKSLVNGDVIYGVNTGFGGTADVRTKKFIELQRALIRELHYGILPVGARDHNTAQLEDHVSGHKFDLSLDTGNEASHLPWSWTRAAILIRINSLISGCSAVRPIIVERMQDLLRMDIVPMIPLRGSISSSGDLSPLSYICGAIQAKSTIRILSRGSEHEYADMAFKKADLEPVTLQAKEGLAMTNGTTVSAAAAALAIHDVHGLAVMAQVLTAMTVEALTGTKESFHPFLSAVRPHPGQIESARNILAFLEGSTLAKVNDGADSSLRQDRYSIRTAPQWLGPILEDIVLAHQQISIECNSATDNPLVTPEGEFLHGGNFQAKSVTSAMEKVRQGVQGIGRMIFSQCTEMINPATNRGLPPNLLAEDPSISLIFKGTDLNIAALTSELGFLANPVNHVQTAEMGNQSLNSLALISARYTHTANDVLSQLMAAHLIAVCQALDLRAMHVQFLEAYRVEFSDVITKTFSDKNETSSELSVLLWSQLLKAFDMTASMDAEDRFIAIAKSLRTILLDHGDLRAGPNLITSLQDFTETLSQSMKDSWCAHRDAYVIHGDATPHLGKASRAIYTFLRHTLKVPLLVTKQLLTPMRHEMESGAGAHGTQAPSVGSFTGVVYRALKDGTLSKIAVDMLAAST